MSGERNRVLKLLLVVAIAVSAVGFLTGIRKAVEPQGYVPPTVVESEGDVVEAPTQAELAARHGPNRTRHPAAFAAMARDHRGLEEHVEPASDEEWEAVVARRAGRRAFAGAPPTIPHDIDQQGRPSCVACHLEGTRIDGRTAPPMSHEPMASCTQCHVVSRRPMPGEPVLGDPPIDNTFRGVARAGRGERAWVGAPPTIPHTTLMRTRCASCHGLHADGIRTSHPTRQSCTQCHAPSAELDQRPLTGPPTFAPAEIPPR